MVDKKLIVLALHPNVENTPSTIRQIKNKICRSGMVGIDSVLIDTFWQNVFLPRLDDTDLLELQSKFPDHIEILKTENFSACIGNNAERWSKVIPKI